MRKRCVCLFYFLLLLVTSLFLVSCSGDSSPKKNAVKYAPDALKEIFDKEGTDDIEILNIYWIAVDFKILIYNETLEGIGIIYYISYEVNSETKHLKIEFTNSSGEDSFFHLFFSNENDLIDDYQHDVSSLKPNKRAAELLGAKYKRFIYKNSSFSRAEINKALKKAKE